MKVKTVRSTWMERDGLRLDCNPYMSGSQEARDALENLHIPKEPLRTLTAGFAGGIYNGPQFRRNYVDSSEFGVPFLTSGNVPQGDFTRLPFLRKKDAHSPRLAFLQLAPGTTLISCSGTIGRMTYVRWGMRGIWSSQDVLKVVPDSSKIPPGYVYAFLSSKFGVPLVVSGTYGAIIQHIEPEHIADLPVPRFDDVFEKRIDKLVSESAKLIDSHVELVNKATSDLFAFLGTKDLDDVAWMSDRTPLGWAETRLCSESFRALNYDPRIADIVTRISTGKTDPLGSLCDPKQFKGKIVFTRIDASPDYGVMLLGQRNAFHLRPEGRWISKKSIAGLGLQVPAGTTLIPSHGTLGEFELYCRALIVTERSTRYAYSGDFFRCVPLPEKVRPGYLFAFLRSRTAFRMLRTISTGGKQQEQHPAMMWRFPIPRLADEQEAQIADKVNQACADLDRALDLEEEARTLVEKAIQGE